VGGADAVRVVLANGSAVIMSDVLTLYPQKSKKIRVLAREDLIGRVSSKTIFYLPWTPVLTIQVSSLIHALYDETS
jgi:hypothetical protein